MTNMDAKAGTSHSVVTDPRVVKLLQEAWRHCKAIGAVDARDALAAAAIPDTAAGVVTGKTSAVGTQMLTLLGVHRVWERFDTGPRK